MRPKLFLLVILMAFLFAAGCATTTPYNPFKVSQEEFYNKTKTIALIPVDLPKGLADPESVRGKFEALLEEKLHEGGFLTVPSKEYAEIWKRMTEQIGGYFDPVSGKRDESKFKTVWEHTYRELNTKFNINALLQPNIQVFKINWSGTTVRWHGTSESIISTGQFLLDSVVGISRYGTVPALSLTVCIQDIHGVTEYLNSGGIQLLSKLSGAKFEQVPQHELFANEERNRDAVKIALEPLINKTVSPKDSKGEKEDKK